MERRTKKRSTERREKRHLNGIIRIRCLFGSKLFEILSDSDEEAAEEESTAIVEEVAEEPFEDFEEELAKVTDYINEQEGPKQAALDLLNLVHEIVDDIHASVHRRVHRAIID